MENTDRSDNSHTADGVEITPGLWVWNNNMESVKVDPGQFVDPSPITGIGGTSWDGWYKMLDGKGRRDSIMNGTRMATVFEGLRAADYPGLTFGEARKAAATKPVATPRFHSTVLPDGELRVFPPEEGDQSRMYVLDVLGASATIYVDMTGATKILLGTVGNHSTPRGGAIAYEVNDTGQHYIDQAFGEAEPQVNG